MFERATTRRRFLAGAVGTAAALSLRPLGGGPGESALAAAAPPTFPGTSPNTHLAWVWQFNQDGEPEKIRETLAAHHLGIAIKTHDGVQWMSRYDTSRNAITGPEQIAKLASFFEAGGVPFHAWCVVKGLDARLEASMAASVLQAGARSLSIDLESYPGFWVGNTFAAMQYTGLLRTAQPDAQVMITMDARPWEIDRIPLREFAAAANALAPQVYWSDFGTPANIARYRQAGAYPGPDGVTPTFALDTAARKLTALGLPIHPIGPGLIADPNAWGQFITESYAREAETLSVWRFGTTPPGVFEMLKANPPRPRSYVVQRGDTAGRLALTWGTSVEEIARANGLANVNLLVAGQTIAIPRSPLVPATIPASAIPVAPTLPPAPVVVAPPPTTYVVQPGDSAWSLASKWNTTPARIAQVNGLADASLIVVGQRLRIP